MSHPEATVAATGAARSLRLVPSLESVFTAVANNAQTVQFDGLLYFTVETAGTQTTVTFYKDQAETQPEGTLAIVGPADRTQYPQTLTATFNVTAGPRPLSGNLTVQLLDPNDMSIDGTVTIDPGQPDALSVTLSVSESGSQTTGSISASENGTTVTLSNIAVATDPNSHVVTITANLNVTPPNVDLALTATLNPDGSGQIAFSNGILIDWASDGSGTLILNDGTVIPFPNIDKAG